MATLAFVLSTLGTICICSASFLKGKNMKFILLLVFLTNSLMASSYILTGAFNGAVSSGLGAVQTIINYCFFERKNKPIPKWLIGIYALSFLIVNLLVFTRLLDLIALAATMAFIMEICQKTGKQYRFWTAVNAVLWVIYDVISHSYGPLSTHAILLTATLVGMALHDKKEKTAE